MYPMRRLLQNLAERRHAKSEGGVAAIEYALIAGIMVLAIVAGVMAVGDSVFRFFSDLVGQFPS